MPGWLNEVPAVSNNDHGTFNPSVDPTMSFMHTPTSATFDYNQMQNAQLQQRMQNGTVRNGSPAYLNPSYQTQSVVPSKRPRPRDDMFSASPRQAPGALPSSRSQTPQQGPYSGIHPGINGGQSIQAPSAYQHLQHGVLGNASPSPVMQDQQYNSQAIPQRMQTASPSPFSPIGQSYGSQASPPHSDYGSRIDTPQNGSHSYVQGMPYSSGSAQYFQSSSGLTNTVSQGIGPSPYGSNTANMQQPARMYEMRQQQLARQFQAANNNTPHRQQGSSLNPLANPANTMANYQQAARAQQMQQSMPRQANPDQFFRALTQFMQQQGLPLNTTPSIQGRLVPLTQLYFAVMRHGGSKKVTMSNQWPAIAVSLQFPPVQYPSAAQEIQSYWHSNIAPFEQVWWQSVVQQQQRQRALNSQIPNLHQGQGGEAANIQDQFSPVKNPNSHYQEQSAMLHARRQSHVDFQTPTKQMMPQQHDMRQPQTNGFSTPQQAQVQTQQHSLYGASQSILSLPPQSTPPHTQKATYSTPGSVSSKKESYSGSSHQPASHPDPAASMPRKAPMGPHFLPKFHPLEKVKDGVESHGGIQVSSFKDVVDALLAHKPNVPAAMELGVVDIRALTMSLRSGIHAEVRLALDTLATLSYDRQDNRSPLLENCEDLVETLIDCAEQQVEVLAENAAEVSDVMLISPYEEVVRGCRSEVETLQDVPEFGTLDYDLDRSVERLICITTILRNFSFFETNHLQLADPVVVRFITTVIRYLGTRYMLLRTHRNTLDFAKDIITYLSNLSHTIDLPGREEASCILHFLLSFAPSPPPTTQGLEEVMFSPYSPSVHRYLPPAVDSLAKLLARDDPNRTFYKSIFAADSTSTPPYDLLTRTFALAIAPIPEPAKVNLTIVEARKPYLAQGLLAAEIIVTLIPSSELILARSWLNSQDGFASSLLQLVSLLSLERASTPPRHQPGNRISTADPDHLSYGMVTNRGIAVLRRLAEKARDAGISTNGLPYSLGVRKDRLFDSLMAPNMDSNVVRQLCVYAGLEF